MRTEWIPVINTARVRSYFERLESRRRKSACISALIKPPLRSLSHSVTRIEERRERETIGKTPTRLHIDLSIRRSCRKRPREHVTDGIDEEFISTNDFPSRFYLVFPSLFRELLKTHATSGLSISMSARLEKYDNSRPSFCTRTCWRNFSSRDKMSLDR